MKWAAVLVASVLLAVPASACLNDRQVLIAENEFRSSYLKDREPSLMARVPVGGWVAVVGGVSLFFGAWLVSRK